MQNHGYILQLKEQVKVKSLELRKNKRESLQATKKLKELVAKNLEEIGVLKEIIKKKDERISFLKKKSFSR